MIRLIQPYLAYEEVEDAFREVFRSGWFTRGQFVEAFTEAIRQYMGARHAFLTTSATTALWTCLRLLRIGAGDEVIVSDFSFPATANVVEDVGAHPVFADVDPETFNMRIDELERRFTDRTRAVIFVDAFGNPSGLHAAKELCAARNVPLIEDAACAIGSSERGVRCGAVADLTCFSFHPRKLLTTGEGGAITTANDQWADWLRIKLAHGATPHEGRHDFVEYGYNFRLSELQAVMGLRQLVKLDGIVSRRNAMRDHYIRELEPLGYRAQRRASDVVHNVQSLVFSVPETTNRDALVESLKRQGVEATLGTYCLSAGTYFRTRYDEHRPQSLMLEQRTITLPCHDAVDVGHVVECIRVAA